MGSERIIVHLLRLKNPPGGLRLDSFHGHQCIANFQKFSFIAFPYDYQFYGSLQVGHWRGKLVFLSVQVIHIVPMEWLEQHLYRNMWSRQVYVCIIVFI